MTSFLVPQWFWWEVVHLPSVCLQTEVTKANCLPICPTVGASCGAQDSRPWAVWQVMAGPSHIKYIYRLNWGISQSWQICHEGQGPQVPRLAGSLEQQSIFVRHCKKYWVSGGQQFSYPHLYTWDETIKTSQNINK